MFVACSDWTEPTPVDYNPIFPDEQDPSLHEKYEQSLKEYKNRKHTLMLIRFANNPGTTLGEQDFLRSLPDSVDFVVLTNADNLSVYDKEDISKLKRTGTKFLYYKNLSEFYDQCEETENLEEFKTKMDAALKNGESDEFDGYYVQFGRDHILHFILCLYVFEVFFLRASRLHALKYLLQVLHRFQL